MTLPGTCSITSAGAQFVPSTGRFTFSCTQDQRSYACTQSGAAGSTYSLGANSTLGLNCINATASGVTVSAIVSGQQRGNGAGGVCDSASNIAFNPGTKEFSWACGAFQGTCAVSAASTYSLATKTVAVTCTSPAPIGVGTASHSPVGAGSITVLTVDVDPATDPASTGITVVGNLTAIGGLAAQPFLDDGNNGDATASDGIFSYRATVGLSTTAGPKSLPFTVADAQARSSAGAIALDVAAMSNPMGSGVATPPSVARTQPTLLAVTVTPGVSPPSDTLTVIASHAAIGGLVQLSDDGQNGDVLAGDNIFSRTVTIPANATPGSYSVPITITDQVPRFGNTTIALTVLSPTNPTASNAHATPSSIAPSTSTVLSVLVAGGTNPASTGLGVVADLSSLGGPSTAAFNDSGMNGDLVAGDGIWSFELMVPFAMEAGDRTVAITVSDAQTRSAVAALGLSVLESTDLRAFAVATPDNVQPDGTTLLEVRVTPGALPNSTGITVGVDLAGIGIGGGPTAFLDDGQNGDAVAGDNVYSRQVTVATLTATDPVSLPVTVADTQGRTAPTTFALNIVGPDDLSAAGAATPAEVMNGDETLLTVTVDPAANPESTDIDVTVDLSAIGGSASQAFFDDGTNGDAVSGDEVFSYRLVVPVDAPVGQFRLPAVATDAELRTATTAIPLEIQGEMLFDDEFD